MHWRIPRIFLKRHIIYYVLVCTSISIPGVSLSVGRNDPQRQEKGQYQSFSSFIFSRECIGSPQVSGCPALTRPVMPRLQACCTQSPRHYQPFVSYDCQKSQYTLEKPNFSDQYNDKLTKPQIEHSNNLTTNAL